MIPRFKWLSFLTSWPELTKILPYSLKTKTTPSQFQSQLKVNALMSQFMSKKKSTISTCLFMSNSIDKRSSYWTDHPTPWRFNFSSQKISSHISSSTQLLDISKVTVILKSGWSSDLIDQSYKRAIDTWSNKIMRMHQRMNSKISLWEFLSKSRVLTRFCQSSSRYCAASQWMPSHSTHLRLTSEMYSIKVQLKSSLIWKTTVYFHNSILSWDFQKRSQSLRWVELEIFFLEKSSRFRLSTDQLNKLCKMSPLYTVEWSQVRSVLEN